MTMGQESAQVIQLASKQTFKQAESIKSWTGWSLHGGIS